MRPPTAGSTCRTGPRDIASLAWNGTLDTLENRGPWALRLAAPATVQLARARVRVGATKLAVADGNVRLAEFVWDDGRITTSGNFNAVPLATAARLAGAPLPFGSTVTLGGEWSLAAAPRLTGNLAVRREARRRLLRARRGRRRQRSPRASRRSTAVARFTDDARRRDRVAALRARRRGRREARHRSGRGRAGRAHRAAMRRSNSRSPATFRRCRCCSPGSAAPRWFRDGRTSTSPPAGPWGARHLSGTLKGEGLRLDAPQYGLHFTDGRIAAHAADGRVVIDEIVLGAGAGTFRASGEIAGLAPGGERPVARLAWRAEKFRAFNRPDLRLVVGGEGTAVAEGGRITISGKLRADEGAIVYLATPDATLGDDVVVKGLVAPGGRNVAGARMFRWPST